LWLLILRLLSLPLLVGLLRGVYLLDLRHLHIRLVLRLREVCLGLPLLRLLVAPMLHLRLRLIILLLVLLLVLLGVLLSLAILLVTALRLLWRVLAVRPVRVAVLLVVPRIHGIYV
jgi:hypothetical protein